MSLPVKKTSRKESLLAWKDDDWIVFMDNLEQVRQVCIRQDATYMVMHDTKENAEKNTSLAEKDCFSSQYTEIRRLCQLHLLTLPIRAALEKQLETTKKVGKSDIADNDVEKVLYVSASQYINAPKAIKGALCDVSHMSFCLYCPHKPIVRTFASREMTQSRSTA